MKRKEYNTIEATGLVVTGMALMLVLVVFIPLLQDFAKDPFSVLKKPNGDLTLALKECKDTDKFDSLACMQSKMERTFNYKKGHRVPYEAEYTYEFGGSCLDYAELWKVIAEEYNLEAEKVKIPITDNYNHEFTIIYSKDGYCLADLNYLDCRFYLEQPQDSSDININRSNDM